jgi:hypothetical protein
VFRLSTPAALLVRVLFAALAPLGRARGYRPVRWAAEVSSAR